MAMSRSHHRTTILSDDSVVVFDEITQRMISLNRTAGYLWFRYHQMVGAAEVARELAERCGMPSADAERTVDEYIELWRGAGFLETQGTIKEHDAAALNRLGAKLHARNEVAEALAYFRDAIALWSDYAEAHVNLAMALLRDGQFASGIAEFEWRWRGYMNFRLPDISAPFWDGRPLGEGTLLLWAEQGLGDSIQFARYAPLLRELAGRVVLYCPPALIRVMAGAKGIDQVVPFGEPLPPCDAYLPLLTVMQRLGTTLDTIPAEVPYLTVDPRRAAALAPLLTAGGLKVGLVWAGNQTLIRNRSVPLAALRPLLAVAGAKFFSLQAGPRAKDIAEGGLADRIIDLSHYFDFADSAAALSRLDLLVTADTSIAHLAGALARPTWLLLPFSPDWRWLLKRTDSPWYPTMRVFRQGHTGEWTLVIQEVATALADLVGGSPRKLARLSQSIRRDETTLRAASWTGEASLDGRLPALGFRIRYEPCRLGELLRLPLEQLIRESAGQVDLTIDLQSDEEGWTVLGDGMVFGHCSRASELVPMVKSRLMSRLLDGAIASHAIAFHASAVGRNGRCVLLPAFAGSGKTMLCAALVQSGFEFISDDLVLLEQGSGALFGAPFPFELNEGSWLVLRRMFPEIDTLPVHLRADRKEVKYLVPPIAPVGDAYPAGWIVFPRYSPNSTVELRKLDQAMALNRLLAESFAPWSRLDTGKFSLLTNCVRTASCYELSFATLDNALPAIIGLAQ